MQAKDVPDNDFLRAVLTAQLEHQREWNTGTHLPWAFAWQIGELFPDVPAKVIRAKAKTLIRRGLMDGCTCGCRGDYELLAPGIERLREGER